MGKEEKAQESERIEAKLNISLPERLKNLLLLEGQKDFKIDVSSNYLRIHVEAGYENLLVEVPIKSILKALRLKLPSWAIVEKVVEKVVKQKTEVFPKIDKCLNCGKKLANVDEVFALTKGRKLIGAFCSETCLKEWKKKSE